MWIEVENQMPALSGPDGLGNCFSAGLLLYNQDQDDFTLGYLAIVDGEGRQWFDKYGNSIEAPTHWKKLEPPE